MTTDHNDIPDVAVIADLLAPLFLAFRKRGLTMEEAGLLTASLMSHTMSAITPAQILTYQPPEI